MEQLKKTKELICKSSSQHQERLLSKNEYKDLTDNKNFWKTIKPFFNNKGLNSNKLMLREKDVVVSDEKTLATLMNNYFVNITADLKLKRDSENFYDTPATRSRSPKYFEN